MPTAYWDQVVLFNGEPRTRAAAAESLSARGASALQVAAFQAQAWFYDPDQARGSDGKWTAEQHAKMNERVRNLDTLGNASPHEDVSADDIAAAVKHQMGDLSAAEAKEVAKRAGMTYMPKPSKKAAIEGLTKRMHDRKGSFMKAQAMGGHPLLDGSPLPKDAKPDYAPHITDALPKAKAIIAAAKGGPPVYGDSYGPK